MPEKALGLGYAGMASMEGTGSGGSCDSVASIASNHSALSSESYDYLSAEERDVLMYLEETIDSLDTDSGLSADDSERVEETPDSPKNKDLKNPYAVETLFPENPAKQAGEKNGISSYRGSSRILDVNPKPSYNSLPKNLMIPRVELVKNAPVPADASTPPDLEKSWTPEKPKRKSLANVKEEGISISEIGLIPPPELFQDTHPIVRHASFKRDSTGIKSEDSRLNNMDGTELNVKSGFTLEKDQHLDASPATSDMMKTKVYHTDVQLQQLSPLPPASECYNEPIKKIMDFTNAQMEQPVQVLALATDREPINKIGDPTHVQREPALAPPAFVSDADPLMKYGELTHVPIQHPAQPPAGLMGDPEPPIKRSQDPAHAQIEPIGAERASAIDNSEPPNPMAVLRPLWKPTSLMPPTFHSTTETGKESDVARSPTQKTEQGFHSLPINNEPAEAPVDLRPPSPPATRATPTFQFHNREVTQASKDALQLLPTTVEQADKDADQNNFLSLSQDHRVKSASQDALQDHAKAVDASFKHGPKTHPKPLKLPPHIIVKTTYTSYNIEPQQRFRTQSLINVPTPTRSPSVKSHIIRDQLTARQEALEKLKLSQGKTNVPNESSVKPTPVSKKEEIPVAQAGSQKSMTIEPPEDNQNNQKLGLQDKTNVRSNQDKPSVGMWSRRFPAAQEKAVPLDSSPPKASVFPRSSEIQIPQSSKENLSKHGRDADDQSSPKNAWQDKVKTFSVSPEKVYGGLRSREFPSRQAEMESGKENSLKNGRIQVDESIPKSNWQNKSSVSTSVPEKVSGSLRQSEIPSDHSVGRESVAEKRESVAERIKILSSSQLDLSSGQGFRLQQGSVPGLREVSFKSNTLERSGIGLSNAKQDGEDPKPNSGGSSFFKKLSPSNFHSNFSKKNRQQRPVSIGTAGEFKAIQEGAPVPEGTSEPTKSENRLSAPFSLFPPKPRPASLVSVKFTPKQTADEHKEALKKLGLLHN